MYPSRSPQEFIWNHNKLSRHLLCSYGIFTSVRQRFIKDTFQHQSSLISHMKSFLYWIEFSTDFLKRTCNLYYFVLTTMYYEYHLENVIQNRPARFWIIFCLKSSRYKSIKNFSFLPFKLIIFSFHH